MRKGAHEHVKFVRFDLLEFEVLVKYPYCSLYECFKIQIVVLDSYNYVTFILFVVISYHSFRFRMIVKLIRTILVLLLILL